MTGVVLLAVTLVGCKAEVKVGTARDISEHRLEEALQSRITEEIGTAPDGIDCPGGLEAEKGAGQVCELTAGEDKLDVTVTVTSIDGEIVNFHLEIGQIKNPG